MVLGQRTAGRVSMQQPQASSVAIAVPAAAAPEVLLRLPTGNTAYRKYMYIPLTSSPDWIDEVLTIIRSLCAPCK